MLINDLIRVLSSKARIEGQSLGLKLTKLCAELQTGPLKTHHSAGNPPAEECLDARLGMWVTSREMLVKTKVITSPLERQAVLLIQESYS